MNFIKFILLFLSVTMSAQAKFTVKGHFDKVENKRIILKGFNLGQEIKLGESKTDINGNFSVQYPTDYVGAAILEIVQGKKVIVLLNHENFEIFWDNINTVSSLKFVNSVENSGFDQGLQLFQMTEEKKTGLLYLLPYYANEPQKKQFFTDEITLLNSTLSNYISQFPNSSYVAYYLKIRFLIANLQLSGQRNPAHLQELESQFNQIDFNDIRLLKSGLYYDLLENYFVALENYGEKTSTHANTSIDVIFRNLKPELKQSISEHLFNFLEKRSLYDSAKYLAISMLNDNNCQLDDKHKALFEQYRKMAIGNTAPDIDFSSSKTTVHRLSNLKNKYKLVIFGASWCPTCVEEIPKFKTFYSAWKKNHNLEIIFISIDNQKTDFMNFTKDFPWISSCDLKGWETKAAIDYSVFATPTIYLLDSKNTIKLKPISADQVDAWLKIN